MRAEFDGELAATEHNRSKELDVLCANCFRSLAAIDFCKTLRGFRDFCSVACVDCLPYRRSLPSLVASQWDAYVDRPFSRVGISGQIESTLSRYVGVMEVDGGMGCPGVGGQGRKTRQTKKKPRRTKSLRGAPTNWLTFQGVFGSGPSQFQMFQSWCRCSSYGLCCFDAAIDQIRLQVRFTDPDSAPLPPPDTVHRDCSRLDEVVDVAATRTQSLGHFGRS